jgi:hypothetical protein
LQQRSAGNSSRRRIAFFAGSPVIVRAMSEGSKFMTEAFLSGRYRGTRTGGLIDRLPGTDMGDGRTARLNAAHAKLEAAVKAGREIDAEMYDAQIDAILDEGRAARRQSEAAAQAAQTEPQGSGFDGGVQQHIRPRSAYLQAASQGPTDLFRAAFRASAERSRG